MRTSSQPKKHNTLDYLLYVLAGAVTVTLCFSVLLWLTY